MLKSIKVRDYMTPRLITFREGTDLFEAIEVLHSNGISGAPVVDDSGQMVGLLSESDCLNAIIKDIYYTEAGGHVSDYMTQEVDTVSPEDDIVDVAVEFKKRGLKRFPVVEDGELIGQISQRDILRAVLDIAQHPEHG